MTEALIGLAGVLLGLLISEYFRRRSRIEDYAKDVFAKRLKVYEELHSKMSEARRIAPDIMDSPDFSEEERKRVWSDVVFDIADFNDRNELYINEEIAIHCFLTLIGVEDIFYIEDAKEQENEREKFNRNSARVISLIRDETGLEKIDRHFGTLTKPRRRSEYIKLYREAKRKYGRQGRTR